MKTQGSWVRVVKFVGVTGLVCGLLVVAAFRSAGKDSPQTGARMSQVAASQASKISKKTRDRQLARYAMFLMAVDTSYS